MELTAARYMTHFQCLGAACSDDCCHGWRVNIDEAHYELLREHLSAAELAAGTTAVDGGDPRRRALTVLDDARRCRFLDGTNLCSIQTRHGERLLPDGCATYPRILGGLGERVELSGRLSCPEVARLVLLGDQEPGFAAAGPELLGRGVLHHRLDPAGGDAYERAFEPVRGLLVDLIAQGGYPVASRLFFMAFFADRTRAYLRRGGAIDPRKLDAVLRAARGRPVLDQLHADFAGQRVDLSFALSIVRAMLGLPEHLQTPRLRGVIDEVRRAYAVAGAPLQGDVAAVQRAYLGLPPLPPELGEEVERLVGRFVRHHLEREWFVGWPSLIEHLFGLWVRVAVLRFLLVSHPGPRAEGLSPDERRARLGSLAVSVTYSLTRILEHDRPLAEHIVAQLVAQGLTELDHAVCLIKV